jgi:hypothetical protein
MLAVMYWTGQPTVDETERKLLREQELRHRRGLPVKSEPAKEEPPAEYLNKLLALLEKQVQVANDQSQQLSVLQQSLEDQKKLLGIVINREVVTQLPAEIKSRSWDNIDVPLLSENSIEDVGTGVAGETRKGKGIEGRIAMLKKLKQEKRN